MVAVSDEDDNVDVLEMLEVDSVSNVAFEVEVVGVEVIEAEVVEVDPIPRYSKTAMHVVPPHSSPASPGHGMLPRTLSAATKATQGSLFSLQDP